MGSSRRASGHLAQALKRHHGTLSRAPLSCLACAVSGFLCHTLLPWCDSFQRPKATGPPVLELETPEPAAKINLFVYEVIALGISL